VELNEYIGPDGDYVVEIRASMRKGDRIQFFERTDTLGQVPVAIVYRMCADFSLLGQPEKRARVVAVLGILRLVARAVLGDIGRLVGVHLPATVTQPNPSRTWRR